MGKRKGSSKRSLGSLPKGLIHRKGATPSDPGNPFEVSARMKRPKHVVHNRPVSKPKNTKHALESLQRRQTQLRKTLMSTKKSNVLIDKRIGEYDPGMSSSDQMLARLVKERTRQSQRSSKFRLDDDDNDLLTHKGKKIDPNKMDAIYSDDEDDNGQLEAVDTELHFGGAGIKPAANQYGGSSTSDLAQVYGQRKTELDDLIARRKNMKAEKMQAKENQEETVEKLDEAFGEFSDLLMFRKDQPAPLRRPELTQEEKEMNEWNREMKAMMLKPKLKATDRTKTPEEIAKDEAERLHELETRRLARMNGDFEEDELSDISLDGLGRSKKSKRKASRNPDQLTDDEDSVEGEEKVEARFTADGLKYFDKDGNIVKKSGEEEDEDDSSKRDEENEANLPQHPLPKGTRVQGNYRAAEQYDGKEAWYDGEITKVHLMKDGSVRYDVEYLDGDFEEDMQPENVRPVERAKIVDDQDLAKTEEIKLKRSKARNKARTEIPYVFEVPTTLESFNQLVGKYATTGRDVATIIERIYRANSVRLNHKNTEKMQNFYDVLMRRLIAVGDAYYEHGDGGEELRRVEQLNQLMRILYLMTQDFPEAAGAVWSRRIGVLQNAHDKRLRDLELITEDDEEESPWLSAGAFFLLKASTSIFPPTDKKHYVVTPINLFLGQVLSQTPILSTHDAVMGILCAGLLIDNCLEAKRVAPEAFGFLAGIFRLFSNNPDQFALPAFESAYHVAGIQALRCGIQKQKVSQPELQKLKLNSAFINSNDGNVALAILDTCFGIVDKVATSFNEAFEMGAAAELFAEVSASLLTILPKTLPEELRKNLSATALKLVSLCEVERQPMRRKTGGKPATTAIKTLAPRMEDPDRYSMSKDAGKKSVQVAIDRTRREYKREHKAVSRELRTDGAFIESERRRERESQDSKARAKRQKNFAWLEGEAATLNQQVALGGGLLKGGGIGAARAKAKSGKLGIKKGGKF